MELRGADATFVAHDERKATTRPAIGVYRGRGGFLRQVVVWVEVKHGTPPHDNQLQAYVDNQRGRGVGVVLLVAPRVSYPSFHDSEIPPDVPRLTWEDTAAVISTFATTDPVGAFLKGELLAYLKEEKLVDPEPLSTAHLEVLRSYHDARRSLVRVCEIAAKQVDSRWGPATPGQWSRVDSAGSYYWDHATVAKDGTTIPLPEGWSLGWQLLLDGSETIVDARPGPLLTAGLASMPGGLPAFSPETLETLTDTEFKSAATG